jgi:hypothetical protein
MRRDIANSAEYIGEKLRGPSAAKKRRQQTLRPFQKPARDYVPTLCLSLHGLAAALEGQPCESQHASQKQP